MIKDNIVNSNKYYELFPTFSKAFEFLINHDLLTMNCGKYVIDGNNMYMNLEEYDTKISSNIEAHKNYIDIQYIVLGKENIGVTALNDLTPITEYDEQKDIIFYNGKCNLHEMNKNDFMILFPEDAHLPCQQLNCSCKVKKAVIKIKI